MRQQPNNLQGLFSGISEAREPTICYHCSVGIYILCQVTLQALLAAYQPVLTEEGRDTGNYTVSYVWVFWWEWQLQPERFKRDFKGQINVLGSTAIQLNGGERFSSYVCSQCSDDTIAFFLESFTQGIVMRKWTTSRPTSNSKKSYGHCNCNCNIAVNGIDLPVKQCEGSRKRFPTRLVKRNATCAKQPWARRQTGRRNDVKEDIGFTGG